MINLRAFGTLLIALPLIASTFFDGRGGPMLEFASAAAEEVTTGFSRITSDQLAEQLVQKNFFFVNVHIPYEGEIERTDAFIPFDKIAENLDAFPNDRSAPIVLYCRSGRMSEIAGLDLAERGFTNVSHLSGGMVEWRKTGHQVFEK